MKWFSNSHPVRLRLGRREQKCKETGRRVKEGKRQREGNGRKIGLLQIDLGKRAWERGRELPFSGTSPFLGVSVRTQHPSPPHKKIYLWAGSAHRCSPRAEFQGRSARFGLAHSKLRPGRENSHPWAGSGGFTHRKMPLTASCFPLPSPHLHGSTGSMVLTLPPASAPPGNCIHRKGVQSMQSHIPAKGIESKPGRGNRIERHKRAVHGAKRECKPNVQECAKTSAD